MASGDWQSLGGKLQIKHKQTPPHGEVKCIAKSVVLVYTLAVLDCMVYIGPRGSYLHEATRAPPEMMMDEVSVRCIVSLALVWSGTLSVSSQRDIRPSLEFVSEKVVSHGAGSPARVNDGGL